MALVSGCLAVLGLVRPAGALEVSMTGQPETYVMSFVEAEVLGFDGVSLGMAMDEVEALAADKYPGAPRAWGEDPVQGITLLGVALERLAPFPDGPIFGPASITYVFGATSKRLIGINLNWYVDGDATPEQRHAILELGKAYVTQLLRYAWDPFELFRGLLLGPNTVLLFSGSDTAGRRVEVIADGVPLDVITLPEGTVEHRPVEGGPARLRVALTARPEEHDVFALPEGSF
ncbi:MAG: hypothetical protein BAA04_11695 [Firmicutes bacterium ZCTH02-B6]|nr:MAG: hypothetical protein BAA04_11695 [Firmicutes bacterium ZCTH02-B6]